MSSTLINVSNRLPVTVQEDQVLKSSGGLVAALEGLPEEHFRTKWIGWPGAAFPDERRRQEVERKLSKEYGYIPIFLGQEEAQGFYEGFSNSSIWPLLHYLPNFLRYERVWWEHYQTVNRTFADKVLESAEDGDLIWVHDYQLMLVPAMLRAAAPNLKIGFFLHTPFPAYEIFRCHPRRSELITGMLGADRIGFHAFGYLRHFASTVQRLLGIETGLTRIANEDHTAAVGVYPIGINARKFQETLDSKEFYQRQEEFRLAHQGKRLVISVERMDYTKGILHRLEAIDNFLAKSQGANDVRFLFVSVPSREGIEEYQQLVQEVEARVGQLNGKYATLVDSPIHFVHASIPFVDLCALYALADDDLISGAGTDARTAKGDIKEVRELVARTLAAGKRIALFLDYDGTLRDIEREPNAAKPTAEIAELLHRLSQHPNLDVTILSGRSQENLESFLGAYPFRLIAEHGATWRPPGQKDWERLDKNFNYAWKEALMPILRVYEQATPGSAIEEKPSSIVWHYRKAETEFGTWKANQLAEELSALTANHPIKVRHGKKMIEVTASENNKGAAVTRVLAENDNYGAILCAGDDLTDESMFELNIPHLLTVKVGAGPTQARFRVKDPATFRRLLNELFNRKPTLK